MNGVKELILSFASSRKEFSTDELWDWISQDGDIARNTVNITLSRLVSKGDIMKVSRGVYAMAKGKSIFRAVLEDREIQVAEILRNKYPFAPFCIYNGKSLVPLQHHLSENNVTYVETDRSAMEAVFNTLKDASYEVWLNPSEDITYKYIDLRKPIIIVKPLVTEAPTEKINDINVPTIEKLLVDIKKDEDFAYLQGSEAQRMWEIGESLYNINQSRLKRYAKRRGLSYIADAAKAAYLATSIELGKEFVEHYESPNQIINASIGKVYTTKLNKLKINNPEAFFYWWKTEELLSSK